MDFIASGFWYWWMIAITLLIIEIFSPTFFALWVAISAGVTGLILYLVPGIEWQYQVLLFAILSVVSIVAWRTYYSKRPIKTDEPLLNRRGHQYIGRVITLDEPIVDGHGKVHIDDSTWKIEGEDCPAGTRVKIINIQNVVLQVSLLPAQSE